MLPPLTVVKRAAINVKLHSRLDSLLVTQWTPRHTRRDSRGERGPEKQKGEHPKGQTVDRWETEASGKILPAFSPRGLVRAGSLYNSE